MPRPTSSSPNTRRGPAKAKAGGFIPASGKYIPKRADHGRDLITDPGGPIIAPGDGYVVKIGNDPRGFGPSYPVVHFTSGPYKGRSMYIGHTNSAVKDGQSFTAGTVLAYTGTAGIGSAHTPGWAEIGFGVPGRPGYGYGHPPFGGPGSPGTGQPYAPPTAPPGPDSTTPQPQTAVSAPMPVLPPNAPPLETPPMPQLPGSAPVSGPQDSAAAWRMIAAQPLSSPESQRWAKMTGQ